MNEANLQFTKGPAPTNPTGGILEVYDPAMCCSSGVCGPEVDPKLVQFAADLAWLKSRGIQVQRHNLSQDPAAFVASELVRSVLTERGETALPLLVGAGKIVATGRYPDRAELATLCGFQGSAATATEESGCCGGGSCC